jgi:hypothetical protein
MKYILLMTGTKAGVDTYRAWTKAEDADAHMAVLRSINKELIGSGEFVGTQGLGGPGPGQDGTRTERRHAGH